MLIKYKKVISIFLNAISKNKKLNTYAFFFLISFAFWLLTMLSKQHETTLVVPVKYINSPPDLMGVVNPVDYIEVRVQAIGVSIILFNLFNYNTLFLDYDVANSQPISNGKNLFWIMNSKRDKVSSILGENIQIMNIIPERIMVPLINKTKKEVSVILNHDVNLKQSFWLVNDIQIDPSSIFLYGEKDVLDSIHSVTTDLLKLDEIDKDQLHKISIVIPNGTRSKTNSVLVNLDIEPFIEEVFMQEVRIRNLKAGYSMKLFPRDISVTLRLSQDKYHLLKTNFLKLYVDASKLGKQKTLRIAYDNLPEGVKIERLYPNRLEFLLIKE